MYEQLDAQSTGEDQLTSAAHVTFRATPDGPSVAVGVPAEQSGRLVGAVAAAIGVGGSVFGPYLMARALHLVEVGMPWGLQLALLALAALLPFVYFLIGRRSG